MTCGFEDVCCWGLGSIALGSDWSWHQESLKEILGRFIPDFFSFLLFFFKLIYLFLFMAVLGLHFCARAFSSCGKRGPLFIAVRGPLTITALSLSRPLLLWSTGSRRAGSVVVAHGPSCSTSCGIFPDQGSNPCPLHWQADSQPLRHQGSPPFLISNSSASSHHRGTLQI